MRVRIDRRGRRRYAEEGFLRVPAASSVVIILSLFREMNNAVEIGDISDLYA
jgi:hypothetical protein